MTNLLFDGDRPTGKLHLGHYVGSLKNRVLYKTKINITCLSSWLISKLLRITQKSRDHQRINWECCFRLSLCRFGSSEVNYFHSKSDS